MKSKPMTAAEFIKIRNQDSEYQKQQSIRKSKEKEVKLESQKIEAPLIKELKLNGINIESVDELLKVNKKFSNEVLDIFFKWLLKLDNTYDSQEFIIRGITKQNFGRRARVLCDLYDRDDSPKSLKWAIANCLAHSKVEEIDDWLINKLADSKNIDLALAAARNLNPELVIPFLLNNFHKNDDTIFQSIGEIGGKDELDFLQAKLSNYKGYEKRQIEKAIKKIKKRI